MIDHFAHLDDDLDGGAAPKKEATKFPCEHCGGTGRWSGGMNQRGATKCFPCNGKGYFRSSTQDRRKARETTRAAKARKIEAAQEAFNEQYPGLIVELTKHISWNDFAADLVRQFCSKGCLSEGQVNAARRMLAKIAQRETERAEQKTKREQDAPEVDLAAIRAMFETAAANGLKRPTYRAEGLIVSRAPDHGKNTGCLYVRAGEAYLGKITHENKFLATREAAQETTAALHAIAANPLEAAVRYGRLTGSCSCCGRELTNKTSVEAGIGPVCATKYGF